MSKAISPLGRKVTFCFENQGPIEGEVIHVPQDTGDCWVISTETRISGTGKFRTAQIFIQNFTYMHFDTTKL